MDIKNFKSLMEAYSEVYAPQQIDEIIDEAIRNPESRAKLRSMMDREVRKGDKSKGENPRSKYPTEKGKQASHLLVGRDETGSEKAPVRKRGGTNAPADERPGKSDRAQSAKYWAGVAGPTRDRGAGSKAARRAAALKNEELDIFDIVLEFLQVEGYAETLEEAEWLMANELDASDIEEILEAEGSYGQTPKARSAMGKLALSRQNKPASEYSKRGEKTKKVRAAEKQTRRQDTLARGLSGGKKSSRPWGIRGKMTADDREEARSKSVEYGEGGTYGAGSVTKNPKKLRKQKAMGEHD
jgi:hypothetical protein